MLWDDDESMNPGSFVLGGGASALNMALPGAGSVLGMLGSIGSSILGGNSAKSANDQNRLTALYQMNFQREMADRQERLANTAHQREVADLSAAGLNPILSATRGVGAGNISSAAGASYQKQPVNPGFAQIAASAQQMLAQTDLLKAQAEKTRVETANLGLQPDLIESQRGLNVASAGQHVATTDQIRQEMTAFPARQNLLAEEIRKVKNEADIKGWETVTAEAESRIRAFAATYEARVLNDKVLAAGAHARELIAQAELRKLEIPQALNDAVAQESWWKKNVAPYLKDVGQAVGAAGSVAGAYAGARAAHRPYQRTINVNPTIKLPR